MKIYHQVYIICLDGSRSWVASYSEENGGLSAARSRQSALTAKGFTAIIESK